MAEKLGDTPRRSNPQVAARYASENQPDLVEMDGPPNPAVDQHDRIMRALRGEHDDSLFGPVSSTLGEGE